MTYTPGPWKYDKALADNGDKETEMSGRSKYLNEPVCLIPHDDITDEGYEEVRANAHLIAAAPELLEALESLFEHCAMIHKHWGDIDNSKQANAAIDRAEKAIAKAKGV